MSGPRENSELLDADPKFNEMLTILGRLLYDALPGKEFEGMFKLMVHSLGRIVWSKLGEESRRRTLRSFGITASSNERRANGDKQCADALVETDVCERAFALVDVSMDHAISSLERFTEQPADSTAAQVERMCFATEVAMAVLVRDPCLTEGKPKLKAIVEKNASLLKSYRRAIRTLREKISVVHLPKFELHPDKYQRLVEETVEDIYGGTGCVPSTNVTVGSTEPHEGCSPVQYAWPPERGSSGSAASSSTPEACHCSRLYTSVHPYPVPAPQLRNEPVAEGTAFVPTSSLPTSGPDGLETNPHVTAAPVGDVRIVVMGPEGCGKSSFIDMLANGQRRAAEGLNGDTQPRYVKFDTTDRSFRLNIHECYSDTGNWKKQTGRADGVVVMFDVHSRMSFASAVRDARRAKKLCPAVPLIICGNKADSENEGPVYEDYGELPWQYCHVSAKTNCNLEAPLLYLLREITGSTDLRTVPREPVVSSPAPSM